MTTTEVYLEDLVPAMLNPKVWTSWIPNWLLAHLKYDTAIGVACPPDIGWIMWEKDTLKIIYSATSIDLKKMDPNYVEPKYCGYAIIDSPPPSTTGPEVA